MTRQALEPGTWGPPSIRQNATGGYQTRIRYRRFDGTMGRVLISAPTRKALERKIKSRLSQLVSETAEPAAPAAPVITFEHVVTEWLKLEELKVRDRLKARGTHTENLRD